MSRIKSSVKMGQGAGDRGGCACCGWPAAGAAGQFEIAAVTLHRTWAARAASGWPPSARVSAARRRPGVPSLPKWRARTTVPAAGVGGPPRPATAPLWPAEVARRSSPPENGRGGGPPFSQVRIVPVRIGAASSGQHAKRTVAGPLAAARAPAPHADGAKPWPAARRGASVSWRRCAIASRQARGVR